MCAVVFCDYVVDQDEHKISVDELVKRLETSLDTVSISDILKGFYINLSK